MHPLSNQHFSNLIQQHSLPSEFQQTIETIYAPLAAQIIQQLDHHSHLPLIIGINGSQGSGKSTLACFLTEILSKQYQRPTANLSIDDFYHTKKTRQQLAAQHHPLLATRGVPATHDVESVHQCFDQLATASPAQPAFIPRFDKALDDRKPRKYWDKHTSPVDIILFEGWCVGLTPEPRSRLDQPINALEKCQDPDGHWRQYINQQLAEAYQPLFARIEWLIFLQIPSFDCVYPWRWLQEQKLAQQHAMPVQSPQDIQHFIQHFQRLTQWALDSLPSQADVLLPLNEAHQFVSPST